MLRYIIHRVVLAIPLLLLVVTAVFVVFALIPGDPALIYAGESAHPEVIERVRRQFGLDRPLHVRYLTYLRELSQGNMGRSIFTGVPVATELRQKFTNTLHLAVASIALAAAVGIGTGILSALKKNAGWDRVTTLFALGGISIPGFWLALLLIYFFSVQLRWFPTGGVGTWRHYVLPTVALSVFSTAYLTRMTRSALLEVVRNDYIRTARAKGLPERLVIFKHALRNALIPVVTVMGLRLGITLTGSVVTETIFAWPGLGRLMVAAVNGRDYPVIQGTLLFFAATFVVVNLLVDVSYAVFDPRIRYR
ncbi:MAG: ABC transporter permease [Armatimonadetes bacterium]|nr:ABC transporter permease [Armatimonadota bacterium]